MSYHSVLNAWNTFAARPDLIGKKFVFDNRVGDTKDQGTISGIEVADGYVTIHSPELAAAHSDGRAWSPNIKFRVDVDREPHGSGDTIFVDLDESRQIRISA